MTRRKHSKIKIRLEYKGSRLHDGMNEDKSSEMDKKTVETDKERKHCTFVVILKASLVSIEVNYRMKTSMP